MRIVVYGVTGSGKTTFARAVAEALRLPFHEADQLTWEKGWVPVPVEEQRERILTLTGGEEWVLDTMYGSWIDIPLARAEILIGLDYPRWISFGRLIKRTFSRAIDKQEVCNGNTENWRMMFSRDSILLWHFRSFRRKRERIQRWAMDSPGPRIIVLKSPREAERFLEEIRKTGSIV